MNKWMSSGVVLAAICAASTCRSEGLVESGAKGLAEGVGKHQGQQVGAALSSDPQAQAPVAEPQRALDVRLLRPTDSKFPAEISDGSKKYVFHGCSRQTASGAPGTTVSEFVKQAGLNGHFNLDHIGGQASIAELVVCTLDVVNLSPEVKKHVFGNACSHWRFFDGKGIEHHLSSLAYSPSEYSSYSTDLPYQEGYCSNTSLLSFNVIPNKPLRVLAVFEATEPVDSVWSLEMAVEADAAAPRLTVLTFSGQVPLLAAHPSP